MAYRLRSTIVKAIGQIDDARDRLSRLAADNNFVDITAITHQINGLNGASIPTVDGAILRAETSLAIMEDVMVLLEAEKNERKQLQR